MARFQHALSRREALRLISGAGITFLSSRWLPADTTPVSHAKLSPELTEGPYYVALERIRRDITEGKPGVPMRLKFRVLNAATGGIVPNAAVDVWHCDAQGAYSGFNSHGGPPPFHGPPSGAPDAGGPSGPPTADDLDPNLWPVAGPNRPPPGPPHPHHPDNHQTFLRGVQLTDANGEAQLDTIFPGWYAGRATHIHVRVHAGGAIAGNRYEGGHISHTGQLFFAEDIASAIYQTPAYARDPQGRVPQEQDGIFRQDGELITPLRQLNPARLQAGVIARPVLVIDPAATPPASGMPFLG